VHGLQGSRRIATTVVGIFPDCGSIRPLFLPVLLDWMAVNMTSLDASWGDHTFDPIHGTMEVQMDGCIYVIEMDMRFYVLISQCEDDRNQRIFAAGFGPKVDFTPRFQQVLEVDLILTK
jgi:hypothetical protein